MPDLKKMLTLEALSEALPSWLKRSTKPEYNADEIDSTLTTNQFVMASDKDNWNAKGTYSKPPGGIPKSDLSSIVQTSLEKADSALQSETDPTVPSWAKQTNKPSYTQDEVADGSTYKRVTQTEKDTWSGKQNALSTTQMQAVNSGINSTKVAQIETNKTNILYAIQTGVKNILPVDSCNVSAATYLLRDYEMNVPAGDYIFYINVTSTTATGIQVITSIGADDGQHRTGVKTISLSSTSTGVKFESMTILSGTTCITLYVNNAANIPEIMLCPKQLWDTLDHTFQHGALPNYDLTRLEAEDRASLAKVVDSGAKNQLSLNGTQSSVYGLTVTWDYANGTVKVNGTVTGTTDPAAYIHLGSWTAPEDGYYKLYAENANSSDIYVYNNATWGTNPSSSVLDSVRYFSKGTSFTHIYLRVVSGYTVNNVTIKPMICTKAAFGVSQKFVPYRPDMYDYQWQAISTYLLARRSGRTITINGYIANISFTANTATLIGNVNTTVGRPHESVRTLCNVGANAYTVGTLGYLILQQDGNIYVTTAYEGTGAVYVSLSYTI